MIAAMWFYTLCLACCISAVGTVLLPFRCGFESSSNRWCDMSHELSTSNFEWERHYDYSTSTYGTGPSGSYSGSYYIYIDASYQSPQDKAYIRTPPIDYSGDICISFYYHMYASPSYSGEMGDLIVFTTNKGESCPLVKLQGHKSNYWLNYEVETTLSDGDMVVFVGVRGNGNRGDIALDNLSITKGECSGSALPPVCGATEEVVDLLNTSVIISAVKSNTESYRNTIIQQSVVTSIDGDPKEWVPTLGAHMKNVNDRTTVHSMRKLGVNYLERKVVWSNYVYGNIAYGTVNGDVKDIFISKQTAHYYASSKVGGLAVDWVANNVYWTDQVYKWIKMTSLGHATTDYYTVIAKDIDKPTGICVDPKNSYLFWSDIGKTPKIERTNLMGKERVVIVSTRIKAPVALDIDYLTSRIYWVDKEDPAIHSCKFDGNDRKLFHGRALFISSLVGISTYNNYLFAVNDGNILYVMPILDARVGNYSHVEMKYQNAFDVVAFGEDKQENLTSPCSTMGCEGMCVGKNKNSKAECFCPDGKELYRGKSCIASHYFNSPVYVYSQPRAICVVDAFAPDLTMREYNGSICVKMSSKLLPGTIKSITQLYRKKNLYFSTGNDIYMLSMSTSGKPYLLISGAGNVTFLTVDWISNNIYWIDSTGFIKAAKTTGEYRTVIITEEGIKGLVLDPTKGYLYYTTSNAIKKANMDGSSITTMLGVVNPGYITLDYKEQKLYWVEVSTTRTKIHSMFTDTTFAKVVVSFSSSSYYNRKPVSIATFKNHIAWSYRNRLNWAYKDPSKKSNTTNMSRRSYYAYGPLLLYGEYSQPITNATDTKIHTCETSGCSHLCLIVPTGVKCKCDVGFNLDNDGKTCVSADIGLIDMIITSMAKHQIIAFNSKNNSYAVLPLQLVEQPASIDVDVASYYIFWTDDFSKHIKRASFQGKNQVTVKQFTKGHAPKGLAVDRINKMLFYGVFNRTINSMDYNGGNDTIVLTVQNESPQSISLDMSSRMIYWSNWGMFPGISVAAYNGTERKILVDGVNIAAPTGLLFDNTSNLLYWCDFRLGRIESIQTDGTNRTLINYDFMARFGGMTFFGDSIYLIDQLSPSLRKVPKTKGQNFTTFGSPVFSVAGGIVSFDLSNAPKVTPTVMTATTTTTQGKVVPKSGTTSPTQPGTGGSTNTGGNAPGSVGRSTGKAGSNGLGTTAIILIAVFGSLALIVIISMVVACGVSKSRNAILDVFSNTKSRMSRFSSQSDTMSTSSELAAIDEYR